MVNAGNVISNCICFGEDIVTISYQAVSYTHLRAHETDS